MIFAELQYPQHYSDAHDELLLFICTRFSQVQSGHQGDSWIWILDGGEKVAIDTFSSMKHQVKSDKHGPHVQQVLEALQRQYKINVFSVPELEGHEDKLPGRD
ncbi:MAG: hypothetical protein ACO1NO_03270 [Burkholderiaceae bacterium]